MIPEKAHCIFTKCQHFYFLTNSKIPLEAHDIAGVRNGMCSPTEGEQQLSAGKKEMFVSRGRNHKDCYFLGCGIRGKKKRYNFILKVRYTLIQMN